MDWLIDWIFRMIWHSRSKRSEADAAIQALHNTKPPGLPDYISVKRAKDESGEKSMVHHVIHHYQYPPGGHLKIELRTNEKNNPNKQIIANFWEKKLKEL